MYFSKSTNAFLRSVTVHFPIFFMPLPTCDEKGWLEGAVGRWHQFLKNVFIKIKKCISQIFPKYFYASDEKGWLRVQLAGSISWRPFTIFAAVIISAGHSPATRSIQEPVSPLSLQWSTLVSTMVQDIYAEQRTGERWHIWAVIRWARLPPHRSSLPGGQLTAASRPQVRAQTAKKNID